MFVSEQNFFLQLGQLIFFSLLQLVLALGIVLRGQDSGFDLSQ